MDHPRPKSIEGHDTGSRGRAWRALLTLMTVLAAVLAVGVAPAASQQAPAPPPPSIVLDQATRGSAAISALGDDLAGVAAENGLSQATLTRVLRTDPTAWVNRFGELYYVDGSPTGGSAEPGPTAAGPFPYSQTFLLHSRPSSSKVIYLDFDGGVVSGTRWNSENGVSTDPQPPFSLDGTAGFSNAEQDLIQGVFQRVTEDYSMFDVDVTTQDPGAAAIERNGEADTAFGTRAMITPSTQAQGAICPAGCGGIAFVGVFDNTVNHGTTQPAFIFSHELGNEEKTIAEATSHEVGHNLGLNHDGVTGGEGYYEGQGLWAPIMGNSYSRPLSQWSKGEYLNANNTEDDFAVMQSNGITLIPDEGASTGIGSGGAGATLTGSGVIAPADLDAFTFSQTCSGNTRFTATPAPRSPDLDIQMSIYDSTGTNQLATVNPASATVTEDVASGLDATVLLGPLGASSYIVIIDGVGQGAAGGTGYSDYASTGAYTLKVQPCTGATSTSIAGVVRDGNGNPLKGALVTTNPNVGTATTGANGSYSFPTVAAGTYSVKAQHVCANASTQSVTVDGAETADFALGQSKCEVRTQGWIDGTTVVALTGDDVSKAVTIPFSYSHLGANYTTANVSTNGLISFVGANTAYQNTAIPTTAAPNGAIYAFWDDLVVDSPGNVRTRTLGSAPNRQFVIEWNNVRIRDTTLRLSFEVVLSENKNQKLVMQYKGVAAGTAETGTSATIGVEKANGSAATQLGFNQGVVYDGLTVAPTAPK